MRILLWLLPGLLIAICNLGAYPLTLVDGRGAAFRLEKQPQRVISLAPSTTDIATAIGAFTQLCAITEHCQWPAAAASLFVQRLSVYPEPSLETIIAQQPDLILAAAITRPEVVKQLREWGLQVLVVDRFSLAGITADIRLVGQALGRESAAERVIADFNRVRAQIDAAVQAQQHSLPPRVLFALGAELDFCAGGGCYLNALIEAVGGQNVAAQVAQDWPKLSPESILAMDPQLLIIMADTITADAHHQTRENLQTHSVWRLLTAVKTHQVYLVDRQLFSVPGVQLQKALVVLFDRLHPNVDLVQFQTCESTSAE